MNVKDKIDFDDILEVVGSYGPFQRKFNFLFNFVFLVLICMPNLNIFLLMAVPDHWCHVPGRENTNLTMAEWKHLTVPSIPSNVVGKHNFATCRMFNISDGVEHEIIDCHYGYEFDRTWYTETIPMAQGWVCDKDIHVTNTFVLQRMGDALGNLIFGQLGDAFGRLLIYYLTLSAIVLGRISLLFVSGSTAIFMIACFLAGMAASAIFQAPLVIAMEVSNREKHAYIAMLQCMGWTVGFCITPLIMWASDGWITFLLITTLPCSIYLFMMSHLIESPRWLFNKGKSAKCLKELKKVAKSNNISTGEKLECMILNANLEVEKTYGALSLFSNWRLAKNSIILIIEWSVTNLVYQLLTLSISNMGGNPYMNFFWQGLAELPGYVLGKMSCDGFGRKCSNIIGFLGMLIGSAFVIFTTQDHDLQWLTLTSLVILKLWITFTFYTVNLQALETYPVALRQTGCSLGGVTANAVGIIGPYIVYLGAKTKNAAFPYVISAFLSTFCLICAFFLPETLGEKLPENLSETSIFGKDQPFWYFSKKKIHVIVPSRDDA